MIYVQKFLAVMMFLGGSAVHAEQMLNCNSDDSGQNIGCYVMTDHLRVESYAVNQGDCAKADVPQNLMITDPIRFLELSPSQRRPMVQNLTSLTAMIQDHAEIYLDYPASGPIVDIEDSQVTRKMDQLLGKFLLADGTTFASILNRPRAAITAQDWGAVLDYLENPILGSYEFGAYFTLLGGCPIQQVTITANGIDLQWQAQ